MTTTQTFLPYPNFVGSAKVLDSQRLGKQRSENLQIMQALLGKKLTGTCRPEPTGAFRRAFYDADDKEINLEDLNPFDAWQERSVPITRMVPAPKENWRIEEATTTSWSHHPAVLMWIGYEHVLMGYQRAICDEWTSRGHKDTCLEKTTYLYSHCKPEPAGVMPDWFGDEDFHRSHQSNLLRKHPIYYSQFFHGVPNDLVYVWPVRSDSVETREKNNA